MSSPFTNLQEYLREIEAEMEVLRAQVRAHEALAKPKAPSAAAATVGGIPVMHFHGPVEPFTLTARQLETVSACWNEVQVFLGPEGGMRAEPVENAASSPRTNKGREPAGLGPEGAVTLGGETKLNPNGPQNGTFNRACHPLETDASAMEGRPPTAAGAQTDERDLPVRDRLNYGISRIDQPEKANHGWYVRITKKGHTVQKFFADKSYGGRDPAWENARLHRDRLKAEFPEIPNPTAWEPGSNATDTIKSSQDHFDPSSEEGDLTI
jgi:hypothetical protein